MDAGDGVFHDLGGGGGDGGGDDRQVRQHAVPVDEDVPPLQAVLRAGGGRRGLRRRGKPQHGRHLARLRVQPLPVVRQRQGEEVMIGRRPGARSASSVQSRNTGRSACLRPLSRF
jgi:hypothetical protein